MRGCKAELEREIERERRGNMMQKNKGVNDIMQPSHQNNLLKLSKPAVKFNFQILKT